MKEIIVYFFPILIGVIFGIVGAGGSILTVPTLVYLIGIEPILATSYSLFIVGITSFFGVIIKFKQGNVDVKTSIIFSLPSLISVYFTRKIIIPSLPDIIIDFNGFIMGKNSIIMVLFSLIMFFSSLSMIGFKKTDLIIRERKNNILNITIEGLLVGVLTGLVGAGGGFIIIPALILFSGLSMQKAVGTSLMIITIKSLVGFMGDMSNSFNISWSFLFFFSFLSILGMLLGSYISRDIKGNKLKNVFGYFILIMSIFITFKEIIYLSKN